MGFGVSGDDANGISAPNLLVFSPRERNYISGGEKKYAFKTTVEEPAMMTISSRAGKRLNAPC